MTRDSLSFLLVAGFLEERLEVLDTRGTCCWLSALFEDTLNKTRVDTSNVVAQWYDQDKLGIFLKKRKENYHSIQMYICSRHLQSSFTDAALATTSLRLIDFIILLVSSLSVTFHSKPASSS